MIDLLRAPLQSMPASSMTRSANGLTRVTSVPAEKTSKSSPPYRFEQRLGDLAPGRVVGADEQDADGIGGHGTLLP